MAGAFHTRHMAPAVDALRAAAAAVTVHDPALPLLSNRDGAAGRHRRGLAGADRQPGQRAGAVGQVHGDDDRPGRVSALIELPPGGTLTGLARRALPGVAAAALKTPDDLAAARALLAEHGAPDT